MTHHNLKRRVNVPGMQPQSTPSLPPQSRTDEVEKAFRHAAFALPAFLLSTLLLMACGDGSSGGGGNNNDDSGSAAYYTEFSYFKASNTGGGDQFGRSVSLSADGNTLTVGANLEDGNATGIDGDPTDDSESGSGAAYVFRFSDDAWTQQAYVKASNTGANDNFGDSVSLSGDGDTLAVGAFGEDGNATGIGNDPSDDLLAGAGAAYLFDRSGDTWFQKAYVKASNTGTNDNFGVSVSLSADGRTLAVGARGESSNATGIDGDQSDDSFEGSGAVYLFDRTGDTWFQRAYVKASNTGGGDRFGFSVGLSGDGDTLAVGAPFEDGKAKGIDGDQADNSSDEAGAVYVFDRSDDTWFQRAYVKASNTGSNAFFGASVSLSGNGNRLAVGANNESSNATGINGDQSDDSLAGAGAVYVFDRTGDTWIQRAYVKASNTGGGDSFGRSVSLSQDGNTLAVGAFEEDGSTNGLDGDQSDDTASNAGAVYVFGYDGFRWSQRAYVKASNTGAGDRFGFSVGLNADGKRLAAGAFGEDGSSTGVNGAYDDASSGAGAAYVGSANP